jgi:serine/threonine protein kinase
MLWSSSYMAPEYIHGGAVTLKSDIFSLGVIILEVITGRRGFSDVSIISSEDFIELVSRLCFNF